MAWTDGPLMSNRRELLSVVVHLRNWLELWERNCHVRHSRARKWCRDRILLREIRRRSSAATVRDPKSGKLALQRPYPYELFLGRIQVVDLLHNLPLHSLDLILNRGPLVLAMTTIVASLSSLHESVQRILNSLRLGYWLPVRPVLISVLMENILELLSVACRESQAEAAQIERSRAESALTTRILAIAISLRQLTVTTLRLALCGMLTRIAMSGRLSG